VLAFLVRRIKRCRVGRGARVRFFRAGATRPVLPASRCVLTTGARLRIALMIRRRRSARLPGRSDVHAVVERYCWACLTPSAGHPERMPLQSHARRVLHVPGRVRLERSIAQPREPCCAGGRNGRSGTQRSAFSLQHCHRRHSCVGGAGLVRAQTAIGAVEFTCFGPYPLLATHSNQDGRRVMCRFIRRWLAESIRAATFAVATLRACPAVINLLLRRTIL